MCYKIETQKRNEERLQKKFDEENIPFFIQRYFVNIESKSGANNYWIVIRNLLMWLMEKNVINKQKLSDIEADDFYEVEAEDITMYLRQREQEGLSPTTLETRKNIFRSFWKYLQRSNKCPVTQNIVESVSYKGISSNNNLIKKMPTETQLREMEESILSQKDDFIRERNIAIMNFLKGTGLRKAELSGLDLSDLYLDEEIPYVTVVGKGVYRKIEERKVYLTGKAYQAILSWLKVRNNMENIVDKEAVFLTKGGKRMNEENIRSMFNTHGHGITPHMLRHWYATVMVQKLGIVFVQQNLGHSTMNTTINNYSNGSYGAKDTLANM